MVSKLSLPSLLPYALNRQHCRIAVPGSDFSQQAGILGSDV